jgi:hypothetical protein
VVKFVLRLALVWGLTMLLRPHVQRMFKRLATEAPQGSFLEQTLTELGDRFSAGLLHTFGETLGDLVFGSR